MKIKSDILQNLDSKLLINLLLTLSFVSFFFARFFAVYDAGAGFDFADTPSYFVFSLNDPIRMPFLTFVFSNIKFFGAITLIQVIVGSFAWIFLSLSIYFLLPKFKYIGLLLILSLGITTPVVELDTLILSESLTITSLVLMMASLFIFLRKKSLLTAIFHILTVVIFSQMKQSSLYLAAAWLLIFLLLFLFERRTLKERVVIILISLLAFSNFFILFKITGENLVHNKQLSSTLIIEKSFYTEELREFWISQGYPAEAFLVYAGPPFDIPINTIRNLPSLKSWEKNTESNPSYRLLKKKPLFALVAPAFPEIFIDNYGYVNSVFPSFASGTQYVINQDFRDGRYPEAKKDWITDWKLSFLFWWSNDFFLQKIILIFIFLNFLFFSMSFFRLRNETTLNFNYISLFILWLLAGAWGNWLTAAFRYERYLAPTSIGLRVMLVVILLMNLLLLKSFMSNKTPQETKT